MIRTQRRGHVAVLALDRPPLHLFGRELMAALRQSLDLLRDDPPRALVLRCDGGGADVRELVTLEPGSARAFISSLHETCEAVRALDAPVIAAVQGYCLGAHLELAAACDLRVCSHGARFGMPEVKVGIPSVIDACWLVAICGLGQAAELVFGGEVVDATEAHRMGLVNRVAEDAEDEATIWAQQLAELSPVALAQQKRVLRDWTQSWYEDAVRTSIDRFDETFRSPEAHEAMHAFLEKRSPSY